VSNPYEMNFMDPSPPSKHDASVEQRLNLRHFRDEHYLPDERRPYHGVSHPDRVWAKAQILMDRCAHHGIPVDGDALRNAVEGHDALSHVPPHYLGFDSPERLAATLTFRFLVDRGYSEAKAMKISDIVMATNPDVRPTTTEEIIMRAADIWNVGATYAEFREGTLALHREDEIKQRAEILFSSYVRGSFLYLERFIWPMLELTPEDKDSAGRSVFHTNATRNMVTLWRETFGDETEVLAEFFPQGEIAPKLHDPKTFYIAIHPEEESRRESGERLNKVALSVDGAALALPGSRGAFPLPDGLCSTVRCHDATLESLAEALRVTKEGGTIILDFPEDIDPSILEVAKAFSSFVSPASPDGARERALVITKKVLL
jgi:hypothetical protein